MPTVVIFGFCGKNNEKKHHLHQISRGQSEGDVFSGSFHVKDLWRSMKCPQTPSVTPREIWNVGTVEPFKVGLHKQEIKQCFILIFILMCFACGFITQVLHFSIAME